MYAPISHSANSSPSSRGQGEHDAHAPHQDDAKRFRALLDDAQAHPDMSMPWQSPPLPQPPLAQDEAESPAGPPAAGKLPPWAEAPLPHAPPQPIDERTLALRACSGPLAGLIVQACWQGGGLGLRLSAPPGALMARLERERRNLEAALSAALGVDVTLEVDHEQ
ncbi:MFS transporter [Chromobacterium sinusclupearum]|uniref:MFS transporter n=1 Tax=Chromobacterium sinusclupearum TaxID=2077146 RepID=A0A2K4MIL6_9NEIS|nr:MFS transporter [Chromobacterium sinusclupearum]POA96910.1 MFS transporter [Chromobacterium sinusclupearum]